MEPGGSVATRKQRLVLSELAGSVNRLKREEVQREEKRAKETLGAGKLSQSWGVGVGLGEAAAMDKSGVFGG